MDQEEFMMGGKIEAQEVVLVEEEGLEAGEALEIEVIKEVMAADLSSGEDEEEVMEIEISPEEVVQI